MIVRDDQRVGSIWRSRDSGDTILNAAHLLQFSDRASASSVSDPGL